MKKVAISFIVHVLLCTALAAADQGVVQLAVYPYYHDPAPAWRLTVFSDGSVSYEESVAPVEVPLLTPDYVVRWGKPSPMKRLSPRRLSSLHARLRSLGLDKLQFHYSADY